MQNHPWKQRYLKAKADLDHLRDRWREFEPYRDGMPDGVLPEVVAAKILGIEYGDPGPMVPEATRGCAWCWEDRYCWMGNTWGLKHKVPGRANCKCECPHNEVLLGDSSLTGTKE